MSTNSRATNTSTGRNLFSYHASITRRKSRSRVCPFCAARAHEDYKEICEDARLEDRAHWELIVPRIYELGGELPNDLKAFHDLAGCAAAKLPDPPTVVNILTLLMESERCAIRSWSAVCDMTFGKDPRTYDMAARILNEEIEHEAWFIELLGMERDGKSIPSGHFRRGEPGHAPYSKNAQFYNP